MINDDVNYMHDYLITLIDSSIQQTWDEPQCRNALLSTCFWPGGDLIWGDAGDLDRVGPPLMELTVWCQQMVNK